MIIALNGYLHIDIQNLPVIMSASSRCRRKFVRSDLMINGIGIKEINMSTSLFSSTVGDLVTQRPGLARVFETLGIDYCCGGKHSLEQACRSKGLDTSTVVALLEESDGRSCGDALDPSVMSLTELADHIEQTHHAYLKQELPRLNSLIDKLAARHGDGNPKLAQLPYVFSSFRSELEAHMGKEEQVLFPLVRQIDNASGNGDCPCGGIENPIRVMEIEHQHAGEALSLMRRLTDNFSTPPGACNTYRAVMHVLSELESDMHRHVHKENNVLFPRALDTARCLTSSDWSI